MIIFSLSPSESSFDRIASYTATHLLFLLFAHQEFCVYISSIVKYLPQIWRLYVDNRPDDDPKLLTNVLGLRSSLPSPLTIILHMNKIGNDTKTVFWFVIMIVLATKWELSLLFKFKSKPSRAVSSRGNRSA